LLVRDGDITLTPDQRAAMTNAAGPAIYICVHAASQGSGVRLYTALTSGVGENRGPFFDWDTAQTSFLGRSQAAAASVAAELRNKRVPVRSLAAPLRPLNNIITAALAVEIAAEADDISQLTSSAYQQSVAGALAAGIADVRDKLQVGQK
jgi:N-acetylmuramoyl-L-alanine amidase